MKSSRSLSGKTWFAGKTWVAGKSAMAALVLAIGVCFAQSSLAAPLQRAEARIEFSGSTAIASHLRSALPRYLAQELAKSPIDAPPGARLVVRVSEVFLSSDFGSGDDSSVMMDALDGEAMIVDARGAIITRKRVTGRMPPSGDLMNPANEPRRVDALAQSMAYWTVRELR